MSPQPCHHCNQLVCRDVEGQLYATHPAIRQPWTCPASPTRRHVLPAIAQPEALMAKYGETEG